MIEEEKAFLRTLEGGLKKLEIFITRAVPSKDQMPLNYMTLFGFPIDLTRLICSERNMEVDENGFQIELEKQRTRSRAALCYGDR